MAKCIKYYEGKGYQLAKSNEGYWFFRIRRHHPDYGWQWSAWNMVEIIKIEKSLLTYENTNGNELTDISIRIEIKTENNLDYLVLTNGEIRPYRQSNFRLPDIEKWRL